MFTRVHCDQAVPPAETRPSEPPREATSWIEFEVRDEAGNPVPHQRYRVETADGTVRHGFTDHLGIARLSGIDPGTCRIVLPNLDADLWSLEDKG